MRARVRLTNRTPPKIKLLINRAGKGVRPQNPGRFLCLKMVPHFVCDLLIIRNANLISQTMLLLQTRANRARAKPAAQTDGGCDDKRKARDKGIGGACAADGV